MSYEPTLLIKFEDLNKIKSDLEEEQYSNNIDISKVALFLLEELKYENLLPTFESIKVILSKPEFTNFNALVRERLDKSNINYVTFI